MQMEILSEYLPIGRSGSPSSRPASLSVTVGGSLILEAMWGNKNTFPGFKFRHFTVRRQR